MKPQRKKAKSKRFTRKKLTRHKATQVPEPTTFHFLALPAEIRNMIYRLLVVPYKIKPWDPIEQEPHLRTKAWWHRGEDQTEHFRTYDVSLQHDATIVLLNRQVRTEFLVVYCDNARLLVNLCDRCRWDLTGKNPQRVPIMYMKRCTVVLNVVRVRFGPFDRERRGNSHSPRWMEKSLSQLVMELEALHRLETLEIHFFNCQKDTQRYDPKVVLKPFAKLAGLRHVSVEGDLSDEYAASLRSSMMRSKTTLARRSRRDVWLRRGLRYPTLQAVGGSLEVLSTIRPIQRPRAPSVYRLCEP